MAQPAESNWGGRLSRANIASDKQLRKRSAVDRIGHSVYIRPSGPGYLIDHPEAFAQLFSRIFDELRYFALQWFAVADKFIRVGRKPTPPSTKEPEP